MINEHDKGSQNYNLKSHNSKITVVITTYNLEKILPKCLIELFRQTFELPYL